jgi:hypothetical protein
MASGTATLIVNTGDGERRVTLDAYLGADCAERAELEANAWIKSLRHVPIGGRPLRDRFLFRGDSLWWFAELFLYKRRVVADILRTIFALDAMFERERPLALGVAEGSAVVVHLARQCAEKRKLQWRGAPSPRRASWRRRLDPVLRGALYTASAFIDRFKPGRHRSQPGDPAVVVAFVHSAFWRPATEDESYIGPVLKEVARLVGDERLALVGLGPPTNFPSRTWWQRVGQFFTSPASSLPFRTVASYASGPQLAPSARVWADRNANRDALLHSRELQAACAFRGCDAWPLLRDEFTGVTHLQFPWSARTMDEIGAALDALAPRVAITYAEAGGSGRALVLEGRRRGIRVVGLQHGFIYRHWLNYLHEEDEMRPSSVNPADGGFPKPDLTILYDQFAAQHLVQAGHFPAEHLFVAGSPKLDAFLQTARSMDTAARESLRTSVGARPGQKLAVVATKYSQIADAFGAVIDAVAGMPDVQLVVKCHPAETAAPYEHAARGAANVRVAPPSAELSRLVAAADVLVTVNSTAAVEAMPLDVPALVVALPNNLSPFVEAGAVAGARTAAEIEPTLRAVLYDKEFRERLARGRRAFMSRYQIGADGRSAIRAAEAIARLASA